MSEALHMSTSGKIKLKICGMRQADNILAVAGAGPDMLGFIFYPPSPRFLPPGDARKVVELVPEDIKRAGVFVDSELEDLLRTGRALKLDYLQLHGKEPPGICAELKKSGFRVIKVFGVDERFNPGDLEPYKGVVDYFLFDTKSPQHGGTGRMFDWQILKDYDGEVPFFLSGGIGLQHLDLLGELRGKNLYALDVNSGVELKPGLKDVQKVRELAARLKDLNNN